MSIFSSLSGSKQRSDMRNGAREFSRHARYGQDTLRTAGQKANNYLQPYQQQGARANTLYGNAIGANGNTAQSDYWQGYQSDPQRLYDENRSIDAVQRSMAARGMGSSGMAALAGARAGMDMGRSYTQERLNRLQGLGGQGLGAAQQMGANEMNTGSGIANLQLQEAQSQQGLNQGLASTRNMGWQNAMSLGGLAMQAFAPGAGGVSPGGNMLGGINKLFGS